MNEQELESGVYCWRNLVNNKRYVGSAVRLVKRMGSHRSSLNGGTHRNVHLQRAWNKYGGAKFVFQILERCPADQLIRREQYWMNRFGSYNPTYGYNICPTAGSMLGFNHSNDSKKLISMAVKSRPPEHWSKLSALLTSRKLSDAHRKAIAEAQRVSMNNPETKRRISEWAKSRKVSSETRAKISASHSGKILTAEHRAKLSAAKKGRPWSPARRAAQSRNKS